MPHSQFCLRFSWTRSSSSSHLQTEVTFIFKGRLLGTWDEREILSNLTQVQGSTITKNNLSIKCY